MSRWPGLLICANSADAPGTLQGVAPGGVCPNFRPRRPPVVRAAPPDPPDDGVRYIPLTQGYHAVVDAALARDRKARELFGEFANLNLPPGPADRSDGWDSWD